MGNAYKSVRRSISEFTDSSKQQIVIKHHPNIKKMYIICEYWKASMNLNGLTSSLIDIIVKYAYIKYDPYLNSNNLYRLLLVGPESSGKSSISLRYCDNHFDEDKPIVTIGVDVRDKIFDYDHERIMLRIWDAAGKERFRKNRRGYHGIVRGIFIVFDITNRESFDSLSDRWILDISKYAKFQTVTLLVGAKSDLEKDRKISVEKAKHFAKAVGCMEYIEVSAKDGTNIEYCFIQMIEYIRERCKCKFDDNRPFLYPCTEQI